MVGASVEYCKVILRVSTILCCFSDYNFGILAQSGACQVVAQSGACQVVAQSGACQVVVQSGACQVVAQWGCVR